MHQGKDSSRDCTHSPSFRLTLTPEAHYFFFLCLLFLSRVYLNLLQVILEELPKEKHAAALLLLRDRPQPPPPARLLDSTPRSATLTWEAAATFPGEYPLTHHRATLRITAPPATSTQYTHCVASLFIDLAEANQVCV